jgi:diguanylate cyclase (GGDEF)-like protein
MKEPETPPDEAKRLQNLEELNILDTPAEERFDRITRLARKSLDVPIALISLVDSDRQWFKSAQGLEAVETERAISFCGHAILDDEMFIIPDATRDDRFADNPLVVGGPEIRLYAGRPIKSPDGFRIGTICVIDLVPRKLDVEEIDALEDLAMLVESELRAKSLSAIETDLRKKLSDAERRASIDPLTRIWNREVVMRILSEEISRSVRGNLTVGVMLIDIDNFKLVNDEHGHLAGDQLLKEATVRMRSALRSYDSLGRFGGDEFLAVLPGCDPAQARAIGERLRARLGRGPVKTEASDIEITTSVGIATVAPQKPIEPKVFLDFADKALYEAKRMGRDRVVVVEVPPG